MINCSKCGAPNASGSSFCGDCGETLPSVAETGVGGDAKDTHPSDRIVVSRDTQGEVSVKVMRPEGRYLRHACPFCGQSVKVPEGTVVCPRCGGGLNPGKDETTEVDPAIANPVPRDGKSPLAVLFHILPSGEETPIPLRFSTSIVGRQCGVPDELVFKRDPYLSPLHAEFRYTDTGLRVVDRGSLNGVYGQIREPTSLSDGQMILMGEQVFRFDVLSGGGSAGRSVPDGTVPLGSGLDRPVARLVKILADGGDGPEFYLAGRRRVFGRGAGHYTFPGDPLMSQQHASLEDVAGRHILTDLVSTNGTMVRVPSADLGPGAVVRMGSQRFRVEFHH